MLNQLGRVKWNVHLRERYEHGQGVLTYLARYVRGGPLKNAQIADASAHQITFRYRSHRDTDKGLQSLCLNPTALLLRYLQHTPLPHKPIVRHYGLYATRHEAVLNQARAAHAQHSVQPPPPVTWQTHYERRAGQPTAITHCPHCGHLLVCLGTVAKPLVAHQQAPPP
jgi:hypothetical protein